MAASSETPDGGAGPNAPQARFDVARTLEETLFGLIFLLWRIARTPWGFLFEPTSFDARCRESAASEGGHGMRPYARPLTYLTACLIVVLMIVYLYSKFWVVVPPFDALQPFFDRFVPSLDIVKLISLVSPVVVAVAVYAGVTSAAAALMRCERHYPTHLLLASYFLGTIVLMIPVMLILQPVVMSKSIPESLEDAATVLMVVYGVALLTLGVRALYRYLAMLKTLVTRSWLRGIAVAVVAGIAMGGVSWTIGLGLGVASEFFEEKRPGGPEALPPLGPA